MLMSGTEMWKEQSTSRVCCWSSSSLLLTFFIFLASEDLRSWQSMDWKSTSLRVSARMDSDRSNPFRAYLNQIAGLVDLASSILQYRINRKQHDLSYYPPVYEIPPCSLLPPPPPPPRVQARRAGRGEQTGAPSAPIQIQFHQKLKNMAQQQHYADSMDVIPEETDRLHTETHLRTDSDDSHSFELLIKAHDRIRTLELENKELHQRLLELGSVQQTSNQLYGENDQLRTLLRERDIRLANLQRLNQKSLLDYVKLKREVFEDRKDCRLKRNLTALPSQLRSPLSPIIRSSDSESQLSQSRESCLRKTSPSGRGKQVFNGGKQVFKREQRLTLKSNAENREERKDLQFTFDGGLKKVGSPDRGRVLENCFSVNEMSKMVSKVHSRHDSQLNGQKAKLKQFQTFCSSMEKKYSPAASIKKECKLSMKYPLAGRQPQSPKGYPFRPTACKGHFQLNSTCSTQMAGSFNVWASDKYRFN